MPSEVIALKYRPKSFEDLIGQETVSNTLSLALNTGKLSHAYLFSGLRGSGKTSTARIFAKAMLCDIGTTSKPCEMCENCLNANANKHPDIIELDAASHRGIDDIRDLIEQSKYSPIMGRFKIFIVDEAHMITPQAFNAFLKTLEEPNAFVKFILATTDPLKVPSTVLSRTQHFRFKNIAQQSIIDRVSYILGEEGVEFDKDALPILARAGKGSMRDTLTLLDQAILFGKNNLTVASVTQMLGLIDTQTIDDIFALVLSKNLTELKKQILYLQEYELETVIDEFCVFLEERLFENDERFNVVLIDRFFRILSDAKHLLFLNSPESFVLTLMMFKFIEAMKLKDISNIIEELEKTTTTSNQQANTTNTATQISQQIIPPATPVAPQISMPTAPRTAPPVAANNHDILFKQLLTKIHDQNADIGECFAEGIAFVSFENGVLLLENNITNEECKKLFRVFSGKIRQLIKDVFGIHTKLDFASKREMNAIAPTMPTAPVAQAPEIAQTVIQNAPQEIAPPHPPQETPQAITPSYETVQPVSPIVTTPVNEPTAQIVVPTEPTPEVMAAPTIPVETATPTVSTHEPIIQTPIVDIPSDIPVPEYLQNMESEDFEDNETTMQIPIELAQALPNEDPTPPQAAPIAKPEPIAAPIPEPAPVATPKPIFAPPSTPEPVSIPTPTPVVASEPVFVPMPEPTPIPTPTLIAAPIPEPAPVAMPTPAPTPIHKPAATSPIATPIQPPSVSVTPQTQPNTLNEEPPVSNIKSHPIMQKTISLFGLEESDIKINNK